MLGAGISTLLCLLASQVNGLTTSLAKCLTGFDWMSSSINQSPCDVSEELLSVCFTGGYRLPSLIDIPPEITYGGPLQGLGNICFCSTVVYSLLSACSICQNHSPIWWSVFHTNCTNVYVAEFTPQIPAGVKVPAYAYQNVTASDMFNVILARSMSGPESSRLPSSSMIISSTSSTSNTGNVGTIALSSASASSNSVTGGSVNNTPAIIGGVVGGVVTLGLIGALITYLFLRSSNHQNYGSNLQKSTFTPTSSTILPPSTSGKKSNEQNTYPSADPNMYYLHGRQYSSLSNVAQKSTETNAHDYAPQRMPQSTDVRIGYSGMPEV